MSKMLEVGVPARRDAGLAEGDPRLVLLAVLDRDRRAAVGELVRDARRRQRVGDPAGRGGGEAGFDGRVAGLGREVVDPVHRRHDGQQRDDQRDLRTGLQRAPEIAKG